MGARMSDQQHGMEKWEMLARGQPGPKGETGEQGPRGLARLSRSSTYALAGIAASVLVVVGCALGLAFSSVSDAHHSEQVAQHGEQLAKRGEQLARQALTKISHHNALCIAIGQLAANDAPSGSAAANPSRAYEQTQHATFVQLHQQLGCEKGD
jgi:hypothetical protein